MGVLIGPCRGGSMSRGVCVDCGTPVAYNTYPSMMKLEERLIDGG